ncbi:MAG: arylesterase [Burkholderiales bacterium]|nr:arylesterase [Burkholderiales bacterium]
MNRSRHSGYLPAILVLLVLLLAGCGKAPKLPALAANDVVVAFGDSLTYGTGAKAEESYPVVLGRLINRQVVRAGVPGEVTAQGVLRLPQMLDEHSPQLVIVCLGGNDMLRRADPAQTKANLHAMLQMLKERGIAAVLVGVPRPALLAGAPEFYEELAREFAIPYEGGIVKDVLYSADTKSDPIHPNAEGYRRMAQAIAELLRKSGAI